MNATFTWKFSSLASLADHLENKASEARTNAARFKPKTHKYIEYSMRAAELESLAYMLHHTELGKSK